MHRTLLDLLAVLWAELCFAPFLVVPGYVFARALNLCEFRVRSLTERLLWAVALSTPVSILLAVWLGHAGSNAFLVAFAAAALLLVSQVRFSFVRQRLSRLRNWDRTTAMVAGAMLGLALYCALATLGITVGHKLYEGTYAADWSVRVPLTAAALHGGVPMANPFYGIGGATVPLRYYFYWYALCGTLGRVAHVSARTALAASSTWAAFALCSVLFLSLKYLFRPSVDAEPEDPGDRSTLRQLCLLALPVSCILGLDLVPSVAAALMRPTRLFPEMEWWRSQGDYAMSFHAAVLYAPHHTAGLAMGMLAFLLLSFCARREGLLAISAKQMAAYSVAAALCLAAAVGTSTYLAVVFGGACALLLAERAYAKDWRTVRAIALSGAVALVLAAPFLHSVLAGAGASLHSGDPHSAHARFLALAPRNVGLTGVYLVLLGRHIAWFAHTHGAVQLLLRAALTLLLFAAELGFFGFVLGWRAVHDLHLPGFLRAGRQALPAQQRMQWVLVAALGFAALVLTSRPVIGQNDLGRHTGLALRLVAVLWATPLVARALNDPGWSVLRRRGWMAAVTACIVLGLSAQIWQAVVQRSYLWLVDRGAITHPAAPFPRFPHYGSRYFAMREAYESLDRLLPPDARIQYNPTTTETTLISDYLDRAVAAEDADCGTPFGGDIGRCHDAMPQLRSLFGGGRPVTGEPQPFYPALATTAALDAVCREHHLAAVLATASDRVWTEPQSWVWQRPALVANGSVRVVACPTP